MDRVELAELAEQLLEVHRETLLIDRFFRISVEVLEGEFHSKCEKDETSALSWTIQLNPERHADEYDVQYSIVEALVRIIMSSLSGEDKDGVIARLTTAICSSFADESEEEEEEE